MLDQFFYLHNTSNPKYIVLGQIGLSNSVDTDQPPQNAVSDQDLH